MQSKKSVSKIYDAVIIGSGASGGMAAKQLTEKGMTVLVLEAGPLIKADQFAMNANSYDSMYRGFPVGCFLFWEKKWTGITPARKEKINSFYASVQQRVQQ